MKLGAGRLRFRQPLEAHFGAMLDQRAEMRPKLLS